MAYEVSAPWRAAEYAQKLLGIKVDGVWGKQTQEAYENASPALRGEIDNYLREQSLSAYSVARVTTQVKSPNPVAKLAAPVAKKNRFLYVADEAYIRRSLNEAGITGVSEENFIRQARKESSLIANIRERVPNDAAWVKRNLRSFMHMTEAGIREVMRKGERHYFEQAYGSHTSKGKELGNLAPGDGYDFRGGGAIQVTGRDNWTTFAKFSGVDVIGNRALLNQTPVLMAASIWFWKQRVGGASLDMQAVRRIVNPGLV